MKISELIEQLQNILEADGDREIDFFKRENPHYCTGLDFDSVSVDEDDKDANTCSFYLHGNNIT
tara:strand:+ start:14867 stop:15058 length:192 start_codon:yes stop_codon:yes gene_type:complete